MPTVYLSPSTQEFNIGVGNYGTEEERMNQIADVIERELLQRGDFTVYRNSKDMTARQSAQDSNTKYPDLHVSLHSNAGGGRGAEVYVNSSNSPAYHFANLVFDNLSTITPSPDRGIILNDTFIEIVGTIAPSALIEIAYHDDSEDANWLVNHIEEIGIQIADAIVQHFASE